MLKLSTKKVLTILPIVLVLGGCANKISTIDGNPDKSAQVLTSPDLTLTQTPETPFYKVMNNHNINFDCTNITLTDYLNSGISVGSITPNGVPGNQVCALMKSSDNKLLGTIETNGGDSYTKLITDTNSPIGIPKDSQILNISGDKVVQIKSLNSCQEVAYFENYAIFSRFPECETANAVMNIIIPKLTP